MKKLLVIVFALVLASAVYAHPPTDIMFKFDLKASTVTLDIMHNVKDPTEHFIHEIELMVNGKKAIVQETIMQTSADSQTVIYTLPGLKEGDIVKATGDCNKFGELTKEAKAEQAKKAAAPKVVKPAKVK